MSSPVAALDQSHYLSVLARTPAPETTEFTEGLLPQLPAVQVIQNRTGLAMLPATDSVKGGAFHLGEVLLAEAHVRVGEAEGYAACLGRDLVQALAIAILDAVLQDPQGDGAVKAEILHFVERQAERQATADTDLLRKVETTRVELEVF